LVAKTDARAVKCHGYNSFYTKLDSKKKETAKQGQQLGAQQHNVCSKTFVMSVQHSQFITLKT